jgi:hypothetical protein
MANTVTAQYIQDIPKNKIRTIYKPIGNFGQMMLFKIMHHEKNIVVINRAGLLRYIGDAQLCYCYGQKGKEFKEFKNALSAANYINKQLLKNE